MTTTSGARSQDDQAAAIQGFSALCAYVERTGRDANGSFAAMLADLMHMCDLTGEDWPAQLQAATELYTAQRGCAL